jgi:zinc transporter 9
MLNALGAGLLIGTSLMVVIPEGVETIYSSRNAVFLTSSTSHSSTTTPNWSSVDEERGYTVEKEEAIQMVKKREPNHENEEGEKAEGKEHSAIGLSLLIGFALMFIIDQVSSLHLPNPIGNETAAEYTELGAVGGGNLEREEEEEEQGQRIHRVGTLPSMAPTIGLVVHAAADGIALGASATHPQLSLVVFIAIMLHKAPASFALTSVLLAAGLSHTTIRKHLLLFAIAAPLGSLLTYFGLYFFSSGTTSVQTLEYWTGVLLVFSGGTFLYVAMHALQEVSHSHRNDKSDRTQLFIILAGMAIPVLLGMAHSH